MHSPANKGLRMAPKSRPRFVIADDDETVCSMLAAQLDSAFECVGAAADAPGAVALVLAERPDIAILDVDMPGGGAMHATIEICAAAPETAIVILSGDETRGGVIDLLEAGAITYLRKGIEAQELAECLTVALAAHRREAHRKLAAGTRPGTQDDAPAPARPAA
jgi:DNA-binding NarL/FixJ family response regulator